MNAAAAAAPLIVHLWMNSKAGSTYGLCFPVFLDLIVLGAKGHMPLFPPSTLAYTSRARVSHPAFVTATSQAMA